MPPPAAQLSVPSLAAAVLASPGAVAEDAPSSGLGGSGAARAEVPPLAVAAAPIDFAAMRAAAGLYPFTLTGDALTRYIKQSVAGYHRQASQFQLLREP